MAHVSSHSNHHQVYIYFIFIGKCNYIKLPSQYLWDNTSLQKKFLLLFLALHLWWIVASSTIAVCGLGPATYVPNSLYLQIIVHAGLFPLFHLVSGLRSFSIYIFFMGWGCKPHTQPPTWSTRVSHLVWVITLMYLAWETLPVIMLLPT